VLQRRVLLFTPPLGRLYECDAAAAACVSRVLSEAHSFEGRQFAQPGLQVAVEDNGAVAHFPGLEAARLYLLIDGASADIGGPCCVDNRPAHSHGVLHRAYFS
jgi:hypothetical protein